jgi:hypothetical protein
MRDGGAGLFRKDGRMLVGCLWGVFAGTFFTYTEMGRDEALFGMSVVG